jgi:alpha-mannosidase
VSNPRIQVMALKKAELNDEIVLRMVEMDGWPQEKRTRSTCRRAPGQ